jgi:two-component system cell cycle sensor histidine kinase/response regulator CckA
MNPKFRELFGFDLSDVPDGRTWFRKTYPNPTYRHHIIELWIKDLESFKKGERISRVFTATCKDGTKKIVNFISVRLETGEYLMTCEDITERKQAEESLKESEEKYRSLVEESIQGIVIGQGNPPHLVFANPAMTMILGYTYEELSSLSPKGIESLVHPEDRAFFFKNYKDRLEGKLVIPHYELRGIRKDGTVVWLELSSVRIEYKGQPAVQAAFLDITERKQAEEALRESEERYRTILENIEDGYYEVDIAGNVTFCNDSFGRLFGYSKDEMMGMNNRQYTDEENAQKLYQAFNKVYRTREPTKTFDLAVIGKDGTKLFGEVSVSLITDAKGQPIGFRGIARDITQRKQAEEALRTEKQRFQTLTENSPFGMVMIDQDGTFKYMNPKFRELFGYDLADIPDGKTWFKKAYPNSTYRHDVIETWINDLKSFKPGEKRSRIFTVTCKDGTEKIINFIPVQLETGENLMACENITERKRAEEALKKSEVRFQELFNDAPVGYFEYDVEGRIIDANRTELEMLGYTLEEMIGQPVWKFIVEEEVARQQILEKLAGAIPPGRSVERTYQRKDGTTLPVLTEDRPLRNPQGGIIGIRATIQDISGLKRAEEEMRGLEEQFRQSQKMEAVGRLGGGIAHDFNNLLTVIKGYSQLSLLDLKESDPLWGNIQEIQKATQRATDLTRQLLAFSRRQILDLKVLDLNTLLRDLDKMLRRIIGEDIELVTLLSGDLGRVKIDPGQIEQVIFNLAVNARDAMASGGKLLIETTNVELDKEYANAHIGVVPGRYVKLSVSDTGIGMSQEVREKVFEPFFTTKDKGKGTGLGLSTVYGIVKQSGGNIWVYSEPGHGTTFKIYLPEVEEELDRLHGRDETEFSPRGSETVLLVEDEQEVRLLAHRLLSQQGYRVLEATNGEEALYVAQKQSGEKIHLLLTDVVMPRMGGKELADQLKILRPDIKVLYTSGYTDDAIVHHGVLEPGIHFLQKPFSLKTLSHKVREVLDR